MGCFTLLVWIGIGVLQVIHAQGQQLGQQCTLAPLQVVEIDTTSITISWTQSSCTHLDTHYVIVYGPSAGTKSTSKRMEGQERRFVAGSLAPATFYQFTVYLANDVGVWSSRAINVSTRPFTRAPSAPAIATSEVAHTSVLLSWTQPSQDVVHTYKITYRRTQFCSGAPPGNRTVEGHLRSFNLNGLEENIGYEVSIRAVNAFQESDHSSIFITTQTTLPSCCVPAPQLCSISNSSVYIIWDREHCLLRNGQPMEYVFRYRQLRSNENLEEVSGISPYTPGAMEVNTLIPNSWYKFEVALVNEVGRGPYSSSTGFTGLHNNSWQIPSCCGLNVQVNSTTPVSITIGWTRENCYKQNIREPQQYQVSYKLVGSSSIIASTNLGSHAIKFTASLLSPSNYYEFEVALEHQTGTETVPIIASTNTVNEVHMLLRGIDYSNNSLINSGDIGRDSNALLCLTPFSHCCHSAVSDGGALGDWYMHGGIRVESRSHVTRGFGRTRSYGSILLHQIGNILTSTGGVYTCQIPIDTVKLAVLYVGIYPSGYGYPTISALTYDKMAGVVTCLSTGGPASSVIWNRSGSAYTQTQIMENSSTATYLNHLHINSSEAVNYYGIFSCEIRNVRGEDTATLTVPGELVNISNQSGYQLGSSASVTCSSEYHVLALWWRQNSSNATVVTSNENTLELEIPSLFTSHHGSVYVCEATILLSSGVTVSGISSISIRTVPDVVKNISATPQDSRTFLLTWVAPALFEGDVLNYTVSVVPLNMESSNKIMEYRTEATALTIVGLDAGVPYNVNITAINSVGIGEVKTTVAFTRELKPDVSPKNITLLRKSPSVVKVSWRPLSLSEARGHVLSYTIAYTSLSTGTMHEMTIKPKEGYALNIGGLQEDNSYIVQIWANTVAGPGHPSVAVVAPALSRHQQTSAAVIALAGGLVVVLLVSTLISTVVPLVVLKCQQRPQHRDKTAQVIKSKYVVTDRQMNSVKCSTLPYENALLEANSKDLKATTSSDQKATEAGCTNNEGDYCGLKTTTKETSLYETLR